MKVHTSDAMEKTMFCFTFNLLLYCSELTVTFSLDVTLCQYYCFRISPKLNQTVWEAYHIFF